MEGHGNSFLHTRLIFQVRKVMCGGGGWWVACRILVSAPVPFLWTLDFGTLDLGLGLELDNKI